MSQKGMGTLRQHVSGWWEARATKEGKQISRYGRTPDEAKAKLTECLNTTEHQGITLYQLLDDWLKDGKGHWKQYTFHHHELVVRDVKKVMADLPCTSLSRGVFRDFQRALADQPYKQWNLYRTLHSVFSYGVQWELIPYHPMEGMKRPTYHYKEKVVWNVKQTRQFIGSIGDRQYAPLFIFALTTGCRISELMALRWDDVDFEKGTVLIDKGTVQFGGKRVTSTPKTQAGRRRLVLPELALSALHKQLEWQRQTPSGSNDEGLIFTTGSGAPLDRAEVSHVLKDYCGELGLPQITPHSLRHLSGSLALSAGASLAEVSRHLGHANISITAQVYMHFVADDSVVASALDRALEGGHQ